jgi:bifunctional DNA-binding transcriptional regulator/antitoxin component of YhaV-PrlF toxin-antitoxin module
MARTALLRMTRRGSVTLPKEVREGLDENTVFEAARREDGTIELRPRVMVAAAQKWFWAERWQQMEREADEDIKDGRVRRFESGEEFLAHLEQVTDEEHPGRTPATGE